MTQVDLESLGKDIESLVGDKNSDTFHYLVERLVGVLGFHKEKGWYEVESWHSRPAQFASKSELKRFVSSFLLKNCAYREKYVRKNDFIISTTYHPNLEALEKGTYIAKSVMSSSAFGLKDKILSIDNVRERFPPREGKDHFALAFEAGYLIKHNEIYFLHPKLLYTLAEEKIKTKK